MEAAKDPLFALQVASDCARRMGRTMRILFVGSGSLASTLRREAANCVGVDAHFHGFATQQALPALYQSARLFLFPTHADVWGIVANEACAAGLPVLISPQAGAAGELVVDGRNGYVRDLRVSTWSSCAQALISDATLWRSFSDESLRRVRRYNFDSAARGIVDACSGALSDLVQPRDEGVRDRP